MGTANQSEPTQCTKHPNCLEPCVFCRVVQLEWLVESFQQREGTANQSEQPPIDELLPCPLCDSPSVKLDYVLGDDDYHVACDACETQQFANETPAGAVARWNRLPRRRMAANGVTISEALGLVERQIKCHRGRLRRAQSSNPGWLDAKEETGSIDALLLIRQYITGTQHEVVAVASTEMAKSTTVQSFNEKLINDYYCRKVLKEMEVTKGSQAKAGGTAFPVPTPESVAAGLGIPVGIVSEDIANVVFKAPTFPLSDFKRVWPKHDEHDDIANAGHRFASLKSNDLSPRPTNADEQLLINEMGTHGAAVSPGICRDCRHWKYHEDIAVKEDISKRAGLSTTVDWGECHAETLPMYLEVPVPVAPGRAKVHTVAHFGCVWFQGEAPPSTNPLGTRITDSSVPDHS